MKIFFSSDWQDIFVLSEPVGETILRGTLMYLILFALLRLFQKRIAGTMGITDLLMMVLVADASQNALAGDYKSIPDGVLLVTTIIFWDYALDWLGYRFPRFRRFVHPSPLPLVKDGRMLRQNMRRELMTEDELMSQLREQGVDDISKVKEARMEGDGRVSVIERGGKERGGGKDKKAAL